MAPGPGPWEDLMDKGPPLRRGVTLRPLSGKMALCKVDGGGDGGGRVAVTPKGSWGSRVVHLPRAAWGPS